MVDGGTGKGKHEYKLESDSLKFASWCIRRFIHGASGKRFGTLELDEQMGTAIHAVISAAQPTIGAGQRIGSAAAGAAWRAIKDIARNLDVADLEITRDPGSPHRQHTPESVDSGLVMDDEATDNDDR